MYCADETATLVRFDRSAQTYQCTTIHGVSWCETEKRYLSGTNETAMRAVVVRIPEKHMPKDISIHKGDFMCHGAISGITRRADLEKYDRFVVNEIRNNCRGRNLRHWAVIGT